MFRISPIQVCCIFSIGLLLQAHSIAHGGVPVEASIPGETLSGALLDPDGRPVNDVAICLASRQIDMAMYGGQLPAEMFGRKQLEQWQPGLDGLWFTFTDAAGKFALPRPAGPHIVLATSREGYLIQQLDEKANPPPWKLKMRKWAALSGALLLGDKPAPAGITLHLCNVEEQGLYPLVNLADLSTDSLGRFSADHLFALRYDLSRGGGSVSVDTTEGKTASVQLQISGRPVMGRVSLPKEIADHREQFYMDGLCAPDWVLPNSHVTDLAAQRTFQQRREWVAAWKQSAEGQHLVKLWNSVGNRRQVVPGEGGVFRIEELSGGDYSIDLCVRDRNHKDVAAFTYHFSVPDIEGGFSDKPLDVGTLMPHPVGDHNVAQSAPGFSFSTLDGSVHSLDASKGKVVVLEFWGTWCGGCIADLPELREIHNAFAKNADFVMFGLSVDDPEDKLRAFLSSHDTPWPISLQGEAQLSLPVLLYGVHGYPTIYLIGKDGKVCYRDWRLSGLKSAIETALATVEGNK